MLIVSPLLLQAGFVPLLFTLLLAVALYASASEVALGCMVLVLAAALPFAAEGVGRVAAFGGPAADVWMLEHGEGALPELRRLQDRLRAEKPEPAAAFAVAHKAKREGDLGQAEQLYRKALGAVGEDASPRAVAVIRNNLGNVYLLRGDAERAVQQYEKAIDLQEGLAAPHFNLGRAYGFGGVESLKKVQAEQARALELDRPGIDAFTGGQLTINRKSNKWLIDLPLDDSLVEPLLEGEARIASPVGDEVRALLAGPLPLSAASALPSWRRSPSSACTRCA